MVSYTKSARAAMGNAPAYNLLYEILSSIVCMNGCAIELTKMHVRIFTAESTSWHVSDLACTLLTWSALALVCLHVQVHLLSFDVVLVLPGSGEHVMPSKTPKKGRETVCFLWHDLLFAAASATAPLSSYLPCRLALS